MTRKARGRIGRLGRGDARSALAPRPILLTAAVGALAVVTTAAPRLAAQTASSGAPAACAVTALAPPPTRWSPPLERAVTVRLSARTLPEALEQVAAAAGVRLAYSGDNLAGARCLPLDIGFEGVPLGQALRALLVGAALEPVAAGAELVVLAPVRASLPSASAPPPLQPEDAPLYWLEPVVVRVDTRAAEERRSVVPVQVISGEELRQQGVTSLSDALNGAVPGIWSWQPGVGGLASGFGSIRGASSFGPQAPKVYVDGIELANPLIAARLSPESIERIEIIRGPEGSALYGAGAIAGVTKIVTRHDVGVEGAPRVRVRSSFGLAGSDYATGSALAQDHSLRLALGSSRRSATLDLFGSEAPEIVPGGTSRSLGMDGSLRVVGEKALVTATLRLSDESTALPPSPLLAELGAGAVGAFAPARAELGLTRYTAGLSLTLRGEGAWTNSLTFGLDGYALDGLEGGPGGLPTLADSTLFAAGSSATRGSLRWNSSRQLRLGERVESRLSLGFEQSLLFRRDWPSASEAPSVPTAPAPGQPARVDDDGVPASGGAANAELSPAPMPDVWDTGLSAQLTTALDDRLFLTTGLRLERNVGGAVTTRVAALPTLGVSLIAGEVGPVEVKLRTAWGRAIRWPELPSTLGLGSYGGSRGNEGARRHVGLPVLALGPEEQSGIEAGIDLFVGSSLEVKVTRFDQTSTGFVEAGPPLEGSGLENGAWSNGGPVLYPVQGIGRIANRGWEMQGSLRQGALSLSGTFSLVDSRVSSLSDRYEGDLLPGDRMLGVPARTVGLNATWIAPTWSASLGLSRAFDWIGYDRIALARDFASSAEGIPTTGLRRYWRPYDGFTHLRLGGSRAIGDDVTLLFSIENLLDRQVGEPDNATVIPGRTLSVGVSAGLPWWK